ncbi:MAG: LysE family translocator [Microbacteriaceae bacterium]|nr:LysE family translocator [Burkholderiaceae bacterium]
MHSTELTALLALATAMSFTPGPNTTLATALAANHGLRRAMPFVCSVPVGWSVLLVLCAMGLGALVVALPWLSLGVKLVGVAYLLWMAARLARSARLSEADAAQLDIGFWQGAALQFVNIKAWMLALAIVSGWIAGRDDPVARLALVLPVMVAFAFASNFTYAVIGSALRNWLAGPDHSGRRLQWFNRVMAAVLAATALWMLWR